MLPYLYFGLFNSFLSVLSVQIFFLGSQSSPDMTLRFVHIQNLPRLLCQRRINLHEAVCHVFMYCALADSKRLCRLPDRGIAVDDIVCNADSVLLDIFLYGITCKNDFPFYEGIWGVMPKDKWSRFCEKLVQNNYTDRLCFFLQIHYQQFPV